MFFDRIRPDTACADLYKKEREEWEALVYLEELGILVLSHPPSASKPAKGDEDTKTPKAA